MPQGFSLFSGLRRFFYQCRKYPPVARASPEASKAVLSTAPFKNSRLFIAAILLILLDLHLVCWAECTAYPVLAYITNHQDPYQDRIQRGKR
ncbi:MAG: hypothetical protein C4B57_01175 [Deltaproteobacteria bacterium]|nr:MAG: hypothetical protein C4B57_01175 [Deltaproteobacteria bacterium]